MIIGTGRMLEEKEGISTERQSDVTMFRKSRNPQVNTKTDIPTDRMEIKQPMSRSRSKGDQQIHLKVSSTNWLKVHNQKISCAILSADDRGSLKCV